MDNRLLEQIRQRANQGGYGAADLEDAIMDRVSLLLEVERQKAIYADLLKKRDQWERRARELESLCADRL